MNVLVVGELNPDLVLSGYRSFPASGKEVLVEDAVLTLGSASAICSVGLARLGNQVAFAGIVGGDPWGDFCISALAAGGVDATRVARVPALKTGLTVSVTSAADRALITYPGAMASLRAGNIDPAWMDGFQHLHVSSYYLQTGLRPGLQRLFAQARERGLTTSLDPGFDPSECWDGSLHHVLHEADVFLPNQSELLAITGRDTPEAALQELAGVCPLVVAKLGAGGCIALQRGELLRVPAFAVQAVDTTGAGDSFNAGFLHAWLRGKPLCESMQFAAACGALSTQGAGGTGSQPDAEQVQQFLEKRQSKN